MKELEAMNQVAQALKDLNQDETKRVLQWAVDKFQVPLSTEPELIHQETNKSTDKTSADQRTVEVEQDQQKKGRKEKCSFDTVADFYYKVEPDTDAAKALVVGYWLQVIQENREIDSYSVNAELKHLGHRISNITRAFNQLMAKKPQLVVQTHKKGTTQQARKKYRLTTAGKREVKARLASGN